MTTTDNVPQAAGGFTIALFGAPFAGPLGRILVWTIHKRTKKKTSYWLRTPEEVDSLVAENRDTHEVYFALAMPPADKDLREDNRVESAEAAGIPGLWIEFDYATSYRKKKGLPTDRELVAAIDTLDTLGPTPSLIVYSGGGYHCYWPFRDGPWIFQNEAERDEARELVKGLQAEIRRNVDFPIDSTHDLARVLRLPASLNHKGDTPVDVVVKKDDGPPGLAVEEWHTLAKGWPVEAKTTQDTTSGKKSRPGGPEPQSGGPKCNFELRADAQPDFKRLQDLRDADPGVQLALDHKKIQPDRSPSGYDMTLMNFGAMAGWPDQELVNLCLYARRENGVDLELNRPDKYQRTIDKARARQPITEEHIETAPLSELAGLGILRILELLDAPNPSRYRIVTEGRTLELAHISHLTQNRKFRDAVGEALKKWPKGLKGDVWDAFVARMLKEVEVIEPGHPDHPRSLFDKEETQERLAYYLDAYKPVDEEDANVNSAPFTKNGVTYLFAHHFAEWLATARSEKFTGRALYSRLKDAGWETHKVRLAQKSSVNAWRPVPASDGTRAHTHAGGHAHARGGTSEHAI